MREYWFARRFPIGAMRSGMAPVHWKGWAVSLGFMAAMCIGGLGAWWFIGRGDVTKGAIVFGVVAFVSAVGFIGVAHKKGDHIRTAADYRKDKTGA
jgi:hypothetical protein